MKILNLPLILLLISQIGFSQDNIQIKGTVKNFGSRTIQIGDYKANIDSTGSFVFQIDNIEPDIYILKYHGFETDLFLEPNMDLNITFNAYDFHTSMSFVGDNSFLQDFLLEIAIIGKQQSYYFSKQWESFISLPEEEYYNKVEEFRNQLLLPLEEFVLKYKDDLNPWFVKKYELEIKLGYDRLIYNYLYWQPSYKSKQEEVDYCTKHSDVESFDFNDADLLRVSSYKKLMRNILRIKVLDRIINDTTLKQCDNLWTTAYQQSILELFENETIRNYWLHLYIKDHLEGLGVKNIESLIAQFNESCTNLNYKNEINDYYQKELRIRENHLTKVYKEINGFKLDAHIFIPKDVKQGEKRPAIVWFHGGGFAQGKPDWHFGHNNNGFISISVEYRLIDRHGATVFEEMSDAKSFFRWLRLNADELHVDTSKIIASGFSVGGPLIMAAAMLDSLDEPNEDKSISSKPNALIINAGGTDLTVKQGMVPDMNDLAAVSAINLVKPNLPPFLVIHGTNDRQVPFKQAEDFVKKMIEAGNICDFEILEKGGHVPWYNTSYAKQVGRAYNDFLKKIGYID